MKTEYVGSKQCSKCKEVKTLENFYFERTRNRNQYRSYCNLCDNKRKAEATRQAKMKALKYKGESCIICGYNACPQAMDFHHIDPTTKTFPLSSINIRNKGWDIVQQELNKTVTICCRCHRELEAGMIQLPQFP